MAQFTVAYLWPSLLWALHGPVYHDVVMAQSTMGSSWPSLLWALHCPVYHDVVMAQSSVASSWANRGQVYHDVVMAQSSVAYSWPCWESQCVDEIYSGLQGIHQKLLVVKVSALESARTLLQYRQPQSDMWRMSSELTQQRNGLYYKF